MASLCNKIVCQDSPAGKTSAPPAQRDRIGTPISPLGAVEPAAAGGGAGETAR